MPRQKLRDEGVPTRADQRYWCGMEWAIHFAIQEVERGGASIALTDAVILLSRAQDKVADHIESE